MGTWRVRPIRVCRPATDNEQVLSVLQTRSLVQDTGQKLGAVAEVGTGEVAMADIDPAEAGIDQAAACEADAGEIRGWPSSGPSKFQPIRFAPAKSMPARLGAGSPCRWACRP